MTDAGTPKPGMLRRWLAFLWRPPVTFIGTVAAIALYVLSIGPAQWLLWNVHLPERAAIGLHIFYRPLGWVVMKSQALLTAAWTYSGLWIDVNKEPATPVIEGEVPAEPPFFTEVSGVLIASWLIWNVVRWMNQRRLAKG